MAADIIDNFSTDAGELNGRNTSDTNATWACGTGVWTVAGGVLTVGSFNNRKAYFDSGVVEATITFDVKVVSDNPSFTVMGDDSSNTMIRCIVHATDSVLAIYKEKNGGSQGYTTVPMNVSLNPAVSNNYTIEIGSDKSINFYATSYSSDNISISDPGSDWNTKTQLGVHSGPSGADPEYDNIEVTFPSAATVDVVFSKANGTNLHDKQYNDIDDTVNWEVYSGHTLASYGAAEDTGQDTIVSGEVTLTIDSSLTQGDPVTVFMKSTTTNAITSYFGIID